MASKLESSPVLFCVTCNARRVHRYPAAHQVTRLWPLCTVCGEFYEPDAEPLVLGGQGRSSADVTGDAAVWFSLALLFLVTAGAIWWWLGA